MKNIQEKAGSICVFCITSIIALVSTVTAGVLIYTKFIQ